MLRSGALIGVGLVVAACCAGCAMFAPDADETTIPLWPIVYHTEKSGSPQTEVVNVFWGEDLSLIHI